MNERRKRIDIVKLKSVSLVKERSISYLPRKISSPKDCYELMKLHIDDSDREVFVVVALDTKRQPTAIQTVSIGTVNATLVHPREVFKMALLANAESIIVSHNHPSGDPKPSQEDVSISERLKASGEILGISLLDHLIVCEDSYYSFKENEDW